MRLARTPFRSLPAAVTALALAGALAVAGCGVGPGEGAEGTATLTVTRDFGSERLVEAATEDPAPADTVIRFLDREAKVETAYSGNFVTAIDGLENRSRGDSSQDWFFYVNGYWSPVGAGEAKLRPGDRVWWDYREWSGAYRVPAVVGSFPEPFVHGRDGQAPTTAVTCGGSEEPCARVEEVLREAGAELVSAPERDSLEVAVGTLEELAQEPALALLRRGPEASGVYARLCGGADDGEQPALELLDRDGDPVGTVEEHGLVVATARGERQPTWVVTGTGLEQVERAVEAFNEETLADRYALALATGEELALPVDGAPVGAAEGACPQ